MSSVRLSDRQWAALLALEDHGVPVTVSVLAGQMTTYGHETTNDVVGLAASYLSRNGLAVKTYAKRQPIRYEITDAGRALATVKRKAAQ